MANDKKKMVEAITAQEVDFAQWYTDICTKAELVEYSSVKGFVVLRPYGYAIWENIQKNLDSRFKATGHENVAMPVLIPAFSAKPIHPGFPILQQVCGTFMDILYSFAMKYSSASCPSKSPVLMCSST